MAALPNDNASTNEANPDDTTHSKTSPDKKQSASVPPTKKHDDDKNIHVPKDKKLKIESVSVNNAFVHNDICFYDIHVKTSQHYWLVTKRYSQFEDLHNQLLSLSKERLPLLPSKHYKWLTDHTKPSFIEKRRALLDNYVKKLMTTKGVSSSQCVVNFFHDDKQSDAVLRQRAAAESPAESMSPTESADGGDDDEAKSDDNAPTEIADGALGRRLSDDFVFPADQEVTNIVIQSTRKMTDHVLYQICVSNSHKRASFRAWTVLKRFTQFYEMDINLRASLQSDSPELLPNLPPPPSRKLKFVHDHMDDDFIEERRVLLENYLSKLLRFPEVVRNEDFLDFLGVD